MSGAAEPRRARPVEHLAMAANATAPTCIPPTCANCPRPAPPILRRLTDAITREHLQTTGYATPRSCCAPWDTPASRPRSTTASPTSPWPGPPSRRPDGGPPGADPAGAAALEQLVVDGHPLHPGCRTRTGMTTADVLAYAPEHRPVVDLRQAARSPPSRWQPAPACPRCCTCTPGRPTRLPRRATRGCAPSATGPRPAADVAAHPGPARRPEPAPQDRRRRADDQRRPHGLPGRRRTTARRLTALLRDA